MIHRRTTASQALVLSTALSLLGLFALILACGKSSSSSGAGSGSGGGNSVVAKYTLSVSTDGSGSGAVTSVPSGINCGAAKNCSASFSSGTQITLTAAPAGGSTFAGWGRDCAGTGTCSVKMSTALVVTATFVSAQSTANSKSLTVIIGGEGSGGVTSSPSGINCPVSGNGACVSASASYAAGTQVALSAFAASSSAFAGWTGGGCSGAGACVVTMTSSQVVTATFNPIILAVSVTGMGIVDSSPSGINCGGNGQACSANYAFGSQVVLTTAPFGGGNVFEGWSGGGCSGNGSCMVTMNGAQSLSAVFAPGAYHSLTITPSGIGGTVTSNSSGINCYQSASGYNTFAAYGNCVGSYPPGSQVTLSASADNYAAFAGWSGACTGTAPCTITMNADQTVGANFSLKTNFGIVWLEASPSNGIADMSPAGPPSSGPSGGGACGSGCYVYPSGDVFDVFAQVSSPEGENAGYNTVSTWSGVNLNDCSCYDGANSASCQATTTGTTQTITATFSKSTAVPSWCPAQ